ncbi:MAG: glycoside hydrolase family 3 C-terminal domain-containing protein [Bacteroidetes bacterium]|nr:glycoside hydrolase family 3 C-terminal domain-containing protein [Bacteroidota bacterium]
MKFKLLFFTLITSFLLSAQTLPFQNKNLPVEERIKDLVSRLTIEEKLDLLGGTGFDSKPVIRLGIPAIRMTDGPLGVRWGQATAFPSGISMGATWDTVLTRKVGQAMGLETLAKERDMLLGPCINIHRVPHGGRNFESYGEDPFLSGRLGVAWVKGVQQMGVLTSTKHFAVNNQEHERMTIDVKVSERAMREIYWPAFETIVKEADTWTIMASYNRLNGPYATANNHLLNEVLKNEWGFRGFVVSDWGAVHGDLDVALGGTDLEMPTGEFMNVKNLKPFVDSGKLPVSVVDDKIARLIRVMMISGLFDRVPGSLPTALNTKEHQELARQAATESIVLLKNDKSLLPLDINKLKSVAVIGPNAASARTGGGGSSMVLPFYSVSPLDAFNEVGTGKFKVTYAPGATIPGDVKPIEAKYFKNLKADYFNNQKLEGTPALSRAESQINFDWGDAIPAPEIGKDNYSVRLTGELVPEVSGDYQLDGLSDDGIRVWIDDKLIIGRTMVPKPGRQNINLKQGKQSR